MNKQQYFMRGWAVGLGMGAMFMRIALLRAEMPWWAGVLQLTGCVFLAVAFAAYRYKAAGDDDA
jgi:hypothetical protein